MSSLKVIAYGGGVQSSAMVVLATQGEIDASHALFSNVGDDSEHPDTLSYVREVMRPWAAERGVEVHELQRTRRDGTTETILGRIMKPGSRSIPIPVRMPDTGAPGNRSCTSDFKIKVIAKWLKQRGASPNNPATVNIGISTDEYHRANNLREEPHERVAYPPLDLGLSRLDCTNIIADAGLPVPPKSACYFCPFKRPSAFAEMRRDRPDLFEAAASLEDHLNGVRDRLGRAHVYLTRFGKPLREAIPEAQDTLFDADEGIWETGCDEGVCFI